jgi:uncharacterized protein (TIGR03084 family)
MTIFDDLAAEQDRLARILAGLTGTQWLSESGASGWTVADVVLHLAQSEEGVAATATGTPGGLTRGADVDDWAAARVSAERAAPAVVFERWQRARSAALTALRATPADKPLQWVVTAMKPATLATTRLAEHWTHGLDITGPLGIDYPDTERLRHIAWLAVRTLPYALARSGATAGPVRVSLTAPDEVEVWSFGPDDAESLISGPAGAFCRVAAQRLAPSESALTTTGPSGEAALTVIRTYA